MDRTGCSVRVSRRRPVIVMRGKTRPAMNGPGDLFDVIEIVPGEGLTRKVETTGLELGSYT